MTSKISLRNAYSSYTTQVNKSLEKNRHINQVGENNPKTGHVRDIEVGKNKETEGIGNDNVSNDIDAHNRIQELAIIEDKVIAHEQAHMSAGGEFTGSANYSYTVGPDGKRYITGGEVSITIPNIDDPDSKLRALERVKQAALAPVEPSAQDMKVASSASAQMSKVRMEIAEQRAEKAYAKDSLNNEMLNLIKRNSINKEASKFEMSI